MSLMDKMKNELFDKAKQATDKVKEKSLELISDDSLANMIIAAVAKQEKVNEALESKGSNYRINDINIEMGIPPKVVFGIRRKSGE